MLLTEAVSHEQVTSVLPSAKQAFWIHLEFHRQPNPVQSLAATKKGSPLSFLAPHLFQLSHLLELAFHCLTSMILLYQSTPTQTQNAGKELYCLLLSCLDSITLYHTKLPLKSIRKIQVLVTEFIHSLLLLINSRIHTEPFVADKFKKKR